MTHPARHRRHRLPAREAGRMGIATDATDCVTAHAQLLAGAAMTARARRRIAPGLAAVPVVRRRQADPAGWVRVAARVPGDTLVGVARRAAIRLMTGRARARIGARLEGMAGREAGAMHARTERIGKPLGGRQHRHGPAVAGGAVRLRVTRLAQIARRCGARAVLAEPVAVMREVAGGERALVLEVHVARIAGARVALLVVTAEAGRHRRPQRRIAGGDAIVAAHAVALDGTDVREVIEAKVVARLDELGDRERRAVTTGARPRVVRRRVAAGAGARRIRRQVELRAGGIDAAMTARTADARHDMRAMWKLPARRAPQAEDPGARGERDEREHEEAPHGIPQRRASCASASMR